MATRDPNPAAVKRELDEFTKNPAQVAAFSTAAINDGYFIALEQARIKGSIKPALFGHEYRRYYDMLLAQIKKSESHLQHIKAATFRMEAISSRSKDRQSVDRVFGQPEDAKFQDELRIFQAWIATLLESYFAIYAVILGARNAERKVGEFAVAFRRVIQAQRSDADLTRTHTELLKNLTEL
jgi:hypothetical protein